MVKIEFLNTKENLGFLNMIYLKLIAGGGDEGTPKY